MDAKATVKVGNYSREGKNRVLVEAADHDFHPSALATPVGLLLPEYDELFVSHITSKVTSDCLVDVIERWWQSQKARFPQVKTLVLNLDNGPENHSRRTQFLYRLVEFSHQEQLDIELAYYPPYHSKYNPIERCWGALERHWNGDILDTLDTVVRFTQTMTWKGKSPVVELVTKPYRLGIKLTKEAMQSLESQVKRLPGLDKWFVHIPANLMDCGTLNSP
jgi:Rhodopirellula transposase DDE domain